MSARENCPLRRGQSDTNAGLDKHLGRCFTMKDLTVSTVGQVVTQRTPHEVICRLVRNSSGITLLPGRVVVYKAGTNMTEVDGYSTLTTQDAAGVVDELLTSGVLNGDDFLIVVKGPSLMLTDIASGATNVIGDGDQLVSLTAVTSQATTAGRIQAATLAGLSGVSLAGNQAALNVFARALSAKTTANTNSNVLAYIASRWC